MDAMRKMFGKALPRACWPRLEPFLSKSRTAPFNQPIYGRLSAIPMKATGFRSRPYSDAFCTGLLVLCSCVRDWGIFRLRLWLWATALIVRARARGLAWAKRAIQTPRAQRTQISRNCLWKEPSSWGRNVMFYFFSVIRMGTLDPFVSVPLRSSVNLVAVAMYKSPAILCHVQHRSRNLENPLVSMKTFLGSVLLSASIAAAAIGPSANIFVANKFITPDGFNRSYVHKYSVAWWVHHWPNLFSAVLAGASEDSIQFPGPLITGNKVCQIFVVIRPELTFSTHREIPSSSM